MASIAEVGQALAKEALELSTQLQALTEQLEDKKEALRTFANGKKLNIVVDGVGKVEITEPREGSEKVVLVFDEDKLKGTPELRAKLLEKGIAKEEVKKVPPAKASVRLKPNV